MRYGAAWFALLLALGVAAGCGGDAYLAALPTAVQYRLDGGSLALLSADGTYVASFVSAAQP
jgi:hypothetical protein